MIHISDEQVGAVKAHGELAYPEECCGMLLGRYEDGAYSIKEVLAIENVQEGNRQRRFRISPAQYLAAERAAAERELTLLGFYHSHPDHPAIPSSFDTEHALPWFTYVIVRVTKRRAEEMTAWVLSPTRERFEQETIAVNGTNPVSNQRKGEREWQSK